MTQPDNITSIERLTRRKLRGDRVQVHRDLIDELLAERQRKYLQEMITNSRTQGVADLSTHWKLVALDDIVGDFDRIIRAGRTAARKLDEKAQAGGDD
jgi:hypothetical protein